MVLRLRFMENTVKCTGNIILPFDYMFNLQCYFFDIEIVTCCVLTTSESNNYALTLNR